MWPRIYISIPLVERAPAPPYIPIYIYTERMLEGLLTANRLNSIIYTTLPCCLPASQFYLPPSERSSVLHHHLQTKLPPPVSNPRALAWNSHCWMRMVADLGEWQNDSVAICKHTYIALKPKWRRRERRWICLSLFIRICQYKPSFHIFLYALLYIFHIRLFDFLKIHKIVVWKYTYLHQDLIHDIHLLMVFSLFYNWNSTEENYSLFYLLK